MKIFYFLFTFILLFSLSFAYDISINTDKNSYLRGEEVIISGNLTENGKPVSGVGVMIEVDTPKGGLYFIDQPQTDENGTFSTKFRIKKSQNTLLGTYMVYVSYGEVKENASFTVIKSCGDGLLDTGEECDDGNTVSGDGCSSTCKKEEETSTGGGGGGAGGGACPTGVNILVEDVELYKNSCKEFDIRAKHGDESLITPLYIFADKEYYPVPSGWSFEVSPRKSDELKAGEYFTFKGKVCADSTGEANLRVCIDDSVGSGRCCYGKVFRVKAIEKEEAAENVTGIAKLKDCLLYTSPSPRD